MRRFDRKKSHVEKLYNKTLLSEMNGSQPPKEIFVVNEQRLRQIIRNIIKEYFRENN